MRCCGGRETATVLKEYGEYYEEHLQQCEEIVACFLSSDLMKRVKRSYCEMPFIITFDGKRVMGKIDRLCELDDGSWVAIDYKSEIVAPVDYATVAEGYAFSLSVYCEAAQQIVRADVLGELYFSDTGEFFTNEVTKTRL